MISRRSFAFAATSCALTASVTELAYSEVDSEKDADKWMSEWIDTDSKSVKGALHVARFKDPWYMLLKSIHWEPNKTERILPSVKAPKGFVTDFASIPRIFWSILRPDGNYAYAAVLHDWLYWQQNTSREIADEIFDIAMADFDIDAATRRTIYNAVRIGGGPPWGENSRLKAQGEKRVLKRFPQDPTTSWEQWKREPNVYAPTTD
jgi:Protein of unknown function (DUF1353)